MYFTNFVSVSWYHSWYFILDVEYYKIETENVIVTKENKDGEVRK
jgi:hypothetical protein